MPKVKCQKLVRKRHLMAAAVSQLLLAGLGANFKKHNLDCSKFEGQRDFKV